MDILIFWCRDRESGKQLIFVTNGLEVGLDTHASSNLIEKVVSRQQQVEATSDRQRRTQGTYNNDPERTLYG
jgi:hypothetical protein